MIFIFISFDAISDDRELEGFYVELGKTYHFLLNELSDEEKIKWENENNKIIYKQQNYNEKYNFDVEYFKRHGNYESIKSILPYSYLNGINELKLNEKTELIERMGGDFIRKYYNNNVVVLLNSIESELINIENSNESLQLKSKLEGYLKVSREIEYFLKNPIIKTTYEFAPMVSAYDSKPKVLKSYVLHDWEGTINKLSFYVKELEDIKDSFLSFNRLKPKDPIGFISIGTQMSILLVTVSGYMISYTKKPSIKVVFSLVFSSMALSLIMIFISSDTVKNIAIQTILPALFIMYWVFTKYRNRE